MDGVKLPRDSDLYQENGHWKLRWGEGSSNANEDGVRRLCEPILLGPSTGSGSLTQNEAQRIALQDYLPLLNQSELAQRSRITIAEFVEHKFVPEHVALKGYSGQMHYQAMLRHVILPEEVDRAFNVNPETSKRRLRAIPDWPYLSNLRLCDARPEHIHRLISVALERGYSAQTVAHIRNVISVIFSHAKKELCFNGDNPTSQVKLLESTHRQPPVLTLDQAKAALGVMNYPEKEMMIMAVLTGMNISEICGLQWKQVNLTAEDLALNGEFIPPRTIAVRKLWYRCKSGDVKKSRVRNVLIPQLLLQILLKLRQRPKFTEPDNFVFASRSGGAVNVANIVARKLKPIAEQLGVPSLSWRVFFRTRKALASVFGMQVKDSMAMIVRTVSLGEGGTPPTWRCRPSIRRPYPR
jgi:integrase